MVELLLNRTKNTGSFFIDTDMDPTRASSHSTQQTTFSFNSRSLPFCQLEFPTSFSPSPVPI
jgi:hypothetical protein